MKLRKLVATAAVAVMSLCLSVQGFAAESDLHLSLEQNGIFSQSGGTENENGKISLGERLKGMAPGETRTTSTELTNHCAYADFYINTETLDTFEGNGASKGYYDIQLSVTKNGVTSVIYDTTLGGYAGNESESAYGLLELNQNLDSYVYLTTLDESESCVVTFTISLDGETVGNSYFSTDAVVDFDYQAVYKAPQTITIKNEPKVQTVDKKTTKYVTINSETNTITILDDEVALADSPFGVSAAKTGDTVELYIYLVLLIVAIVIFALTFKKNKKDAVSCIAIVMLVSFFSMSANAEEASEQYLVTYRSGNVATFDVSDYSMQSDTYQVITANSYFVTYAVKANADYPALPKLIFSKDVYEVNPDWEADIINGKVTKSEELVVDYTKLTNPISYTITYVNESGIRLGEKIGKGNIGETVVFAKNFEGYRIKEGTNFLVLSEDANLNVLTITYVWDPLVTETIYNYTDGGTTTEYRDVEEIVYVPGTTTTVSTTVPGTTTVTNASNQTAAANQTISATQNNTQNAGLNNNNANAEQNNQNAAAQEQGNQAGANNAGEQGLNGNENELADNTVNIPDEPVPETGFGENGESKEDTGETVIGGSEETNESTETIDESEVPKQDTIPGTSNYIPMIITVVAVIVAICIGMVIYSRKKLKK